MNTRVCSVGGGGGGVEKGPRAMGREQIFGTHQRAVQHHRSYILYTHVYTHTIPIYIYIWTVVGHRPIRLRVVSYADRF